MTSILDSKPRRVLIFGNSGAGKTTLAKQLQEKFNLAHLDLDTLAWQDTNPPERTDLETVSKTITDFAKQHKEWVVEGCYADLLEILVNEATEVIYLNPPLADCIAHAKQRPWEPHKYKTKEEQDANLDMLLDWIAQYDVRNDSCSRAAHRNLYIAFQGEKRELSYLRT